MDKVNSKDKVIGIIFSRPSYKFHIREIARITKLHPNTVISIVGGLRKENIALVERKKHLVEVFGNVQEKDFIVKKRIYNLSRIYGSGILDFLVEKNQPELISVIGSYGKGEDIEKSDIDVVVVSKNRKMSDLSAFENFLGRRIHLIFIDYEEMSNEFYTNLINGVVLYGFVRKK